LVATHSHLLISVAYVWSNLVRASLPSQLQLAQSNVSLPSSYLVFILMLVYPGRLTSIPLHPKQVND